MDHVVIEGCPPYDGRYELDLERELTTREWGWIKRLSGYLPLALTDEAFGDPEFGCVLAAIVLRRAGKIQPADVPAAFERLIDAPFGSAIRIETDEPEPGEVPAPTDPPASSSSNGVTSGGASPTSSGTPATRRKRTGTRGSGTSASAPQTSAT